MAENFEAITPDVFHSYMNKLLLECKEASVSNADIYHAIYEATFLMCATLSQLGYKEGIEAFERLCMTPKHENPQSLVSFLN
ncbi:hypothetical protein BROC_02309 [Candidatus Brocadiaceae bacterium]|nr:hypothetical protein BROC_02309 [Candidatus Brocadiaceae bacterium]